jgi:polysaccharide export outer membrane protein
LNDRMHAQSGMGRALRSAIVMMLAVVLAGCLSRGGDIPYNPADFRQPDAQLPEDVAYDLPLGPLDIVRVNVFRVNDLTGDYQVDAKGMLDLPLIGSASVREMTSQQLAQSLEQRYGERHLQNPEITVRVLSTTRNTITVEGGVNAPGVYPLTSRTTLVGAIATARGVAFNDANPRRVGIFRKIDGKTAAAAFDLVAIRRGEMADPQVYPGDTIVVDSSQARPIYRDLLMSLPIVSIFLSL